MGSFMPENKIKQKKNLNAYEFDFAVFACFFGESSDVVSLRTRLIFLLEEAVRTLQDEICERLKVLNWNIDRYSWEKKTILPKYFQN